MAFSTLNSFEEASKIAVPIVEELRSRFLEEVAKSPQLYYDKDIERLKSNEWPIRRFLNNHNSNVDKSFEGLNKAMKWRKSFGVLDLSDKDFPKEFFQSAALISYGKDLNGSQLLILRVKVNKKIKSWVPTVQKFFVYLVENVDKEDIGKGMTLLLDCKDSGIKNSDIDFLKFSFHVLNDYYPGLANAGLVYKMPKVMEAMYLMVRSWLNEQQQKYSYLIGKKTINEYVLADQLPDFLLGHNEQSYRTVPEQSIGAHELAQVLDIKEEKADKLVKHLEHFFNE